MSKIKNNNNPKLRTFTFKSVQYSHRSIDVEDDAIAHTVFEIYRQKEVQHPYNTLLYFGAGNAIRTDHIRLFSVFLFWFLSLLYDIIFQETFRRGCSSVVELSLCTRNVPGSSPGFSTFFFFFLCVCVTSRFLFFFS